MFDCKMYSSCCLHSTGTCTSQHSFRFVSRTNIFAHSVYVVWKGCDFLNRVFVIVFFAHSFLLCLLLLFLLLLHCQVLYFNENKGMVLWESVVCLPKCCCLLPQFLLNVVTFSSTKFVTKTKWVASKNIFATRLVSSKNWLLKEILFSQNYFCIDKFVCCFNQYCLLKNQ